MSSRIRRATIRKERWEVVIGFKNWRTPPDFFKLLDDEFHFTLDAAASHANHLLPRYCTPNGKFDLKTGSEKWRLHGLTVGAWDGERVFCNPPYDSNLMAWVQTALIAQRDYRSSALSVLLLPPSVDAAWFRSLWHPRDTTLTTIEGSWYVGFASLSVELRFYKGRLRFSRPKDDDENNTESVQGPHPRAGNLIVVLR